MDNQSASTKSDTDRNQAAALASLRLADPVLARLIDAHPGFEPRAWLKELPEMDALDELSDEEVEARLTEISGVGPWTAQGFMIIALGREDVVMPGDLALRNAIKRAYGLDHLPTPTEVSAIAEPWRPFRTLATTYLFASAYEG
jgi:3-methyladenine DNA glycosylase/8-oxoguanine DNA glycosylase